MEKSEKYIIESLSTRGHCLLEEFKYQDKNTQFWGVSFVNNEIKKYVIFSAEDKFEYIDYSNSEHENIQDISSENIIKVLLVENDSSFQKYVQNHGKGNIIVIDCLKNKILYAEETGTNIAEIITLFLNELQSREQEQKKDMRVTWILIVINFIVYGISAWLSGNPVAISNQVLNFMGAKNSVLIDNGQYYRLITCMFLHAGITHIGANMYSLYSMGYMLENIYGKLRYTAIYFISGITASFFSYIFSRESLSVGASGAIFGLLGAAIVFGFKLRKRIGKAFFANMVGVFALNIFISFTIPNIDIFAHFGGFLGGVVVSVILGRTIWEK
ncbi:rhomboid protease GluP [Clostridium acetobutylicum]|uniref:Uncharacterized membrane protein n=1 Tax=Clostridium acetobutylicum (strain ATCC 824 / DSM 792 / JCM 1419 / IAM 19013 / LMG 5710 / NBRC 13948 / NRRL B-527 / VKM B-1787 / 2291 / W) TaxID=272562 RepID=Q97KG5_CLOAB|nr:MULTISPECIES: rhomboid family intramembrane serine protease [Clostridium]AAK78930.1 Uncharacterized membrane protein [Clostridium acetobutylicum ATCC 824]ADZ20005.1 Conserved hypothetical protein [Clostridium acetobutylicum EA 2018]AEI33078.1 hypothetical protein SMB_G0971 [Clostridium acetobutylicum DSM 1731]AWV80649.1 rhomboid family intramembrane serine protease [Clostridium acetobutylicum]MBC2396104.1 rhomboid family intramembrane serine protease [Clostridium acetobutylicum]